MYVALFFISFLSYSSGLAVEPFLEIMKGLQPCSSKFLAALILSVQIFCCIGR
jgi:hypothetical protein